MNISTLQASDPAARHPWPALAIEKKKRK